MNPPMDEGIPGKRQVAAPGIRQHGGM